MNTQAKPKFKISAHNLGPVLSLEGELSKHDQNLIFARNGTGKSFLSRAFRYLDQHRQEKNVSEAAFHLVSDESRDGKGSFLFSRGTDVLGKLNLDKSGNTKFEPAAEKIFHVFSEDFIQDELRQQEYEINGEITNVIAVDSDNIQLSNAETALETAKLKERDKMQVLENAFNSQKVTELKEKAEISGNLGMYSQSTISNLLENYADKPKAPEQTGADLLNDLESLRSIPAEPDFPELMSAVSSEDIDGAALESSLQRQTSPSSVSDEIKKKIDADHGFYSKGVELVQQDHSTDCPFCEQSIACPISKVIIEAYMEYFAGEEQKHKDELQNYYKKLNSLKTGLIDAGTNSTRQITLYENLKRFVPSKRHTALEPIADSQLQVHSAVSTLQKKIKVKIDALAKKCAHSTDDLLRSISQLNGVIEKNNHKTVQLLNAVGKAGNERKDLQRRACSVFEIEFTIDNWEGINALRQLTDETKTKETELSDLKASRPSESARDRVAGTFELLLKEFFADKYIFDRVSFALKRGNQGMERGAHRTLSDGEKTAIAFCYFIACVHLKVKDTSDYRKLFLVFDDPVTSMSYDFVFAIAQTLKNLSISTEGEISTNPGTISDKTGHRPDLLIFTHSSYFFNVSCSNAVVHRSASFSLQSDRAQHKLQPLANYVAPFEQQLEHVYRVANGIPPDHSTCNAVRSVLEAVGRFCRPDKSKSLQDFLTFLAGEESITTNSVLINTLSHGTYYNETPPPEDLKLACNHALKVVKHFAPGHIELMERI